MSETCTYIVCHTNAASMMGPEWCLKYIWLSPRMKPWLLLANIDMNLLFMWITLHTRCGYSFSQFLYVLLIWAIKPHQRYSHNNTWTWNGTIMWNIECTAPLNFILISSLAEVWGKPHMHACYTLPYPEEFGYPYFGSGGHTGRECQRMGYGKRMPFSHKRWKPR